MSHKPSEVALDSARDLAVEIVDRCCGYTMEYAACPKAHAREYDRTQEQIATMLEEHTAFADAVDDALRDEWRHLRDDARYYDCAVACVRFARRISMLDQEHEDLWLRRLTTCPGHDDEGGRSWCAFCGSCCCTSGGPGSYEGPMRECRLHGEWAAR